MPQRIQLSRRKGWRKPEGAIVVSRGTLLGNPFRAYEHCKGKGGDWGVEDTGRFNTDLSHGWTREGAHQFAVDCYREAFDDAYPVDSAARYILLANLRDHDLACWCPLNLPCHADVLLEVANR